MLNFFRRAKAETAVSLRLDQVRGQLEQYCGPISGEVWANRFVMGYLAGAFQVLLRVENPLDTKPDYNSLQSGRLWQRFTGLSAPQYLRDVFVLADNEDREFLKGFDRGTLWGAMATGNVKRDAPEVASLLASAAQMGTSYEAAHNEPSHHMSSAASIALIGDFFNKLAQLNQFAR